MEFMVFGKQLAELGVTPTALIMIGMYWQFTKVVATMDKRISILEAMQQ